MGVPHAEVAWWVVAALGALPLVVQLIWYWNDVYFWVSLRLRALADDAPCAKLPPGHMGLPILGELPQFLWFFKVARRPDDYIMSKKERYGEGLGLYRSHLFGCPTIISCSPASNKFILQSAGDFNMGWPSMELVGVSSLVAVHGKKHTTLRKFVVSMINSPVSLRRVAQVVQPRVVSSLRTWAEKGTIRAFDEVKKVTFENICKMFVSMEPGPLLDSLDRSFEGVMAGLRTYPLNFPGTAFHRALKCRRYLDGVFREELERRKRREDGSSEDKKNDLMEGLRQVEDENGEKLRDDEVVDNITSLVLGGYESTALAISWAVYHLSKSPEVLQKMQTENTAISKGNNGAFITPEDISRMKYTSKVVEETIRMANLAPLVFRVANRDVQYGDHTIPKGWKVLVWLRSLHTDPRNFKDPRSFNPDRWNESPKPDTFQVFGGGPRICAGNMLARLQLTLFLHHLSLGYRWELKNPDAKVSYLPHPRPVDGALMTFQAV